MRLIPAIDLHEGQCVRLYQGDFSKSEIFSNNPVEMAKKWEACGAKLLHVVDLDGALHGKLCNLEVIEKIAANIKIPVQVGGGIRSQKTADCLFSAGVSFLVVGTSAYESPEFLKEIASKYPDKILLGVDAKDLFVAVKGWVDVTDVTVCEMIGRFKSVALKAVIYTDIKRDGTMQGPNLESLKAVSSCSPFPVIASGGISSESDLHKILDLKLSNLYGAILGKALYSGTVNLTHAIRIIDSAR